MQYGGMPNGRNPGTGDPAKRRTGQDPKRTAPGSAQKRTVSGNAGVGTRAGQNAGRTPASHANKVPPVRAAMPAAGKSYANRARKQQKSAVNGLAALLVIMIFVSSILLVVRNINWEVLTIDKNHAPFENPDNELYGPDITEAERDAYITVYIPVTAEDMYRGHCILVNTEHEFHFPSEEETDETILSVYRNKTKGYKVNSGSMRLHIDMINAMNDMFDAFYAETGCRDVMVNSAYRSYQAQQETVDYYLQERGQQYVDEYVQKPGFSEHHTGYAVDFAVYEEYDDETSAMWAFNGKDQYFWVDKYCPQYGFILRYSASKEKVTGISYESWHYRYVGIANALAISNMGLALEEYVLSIKNYAYDGCEYYITGEDGKEYAIYYVPWNGEETQQIPIPSTAIDYEISGNNFDGFIVCAQIGTGNALK